MSSALPLCRLTTLSLAVGVLSAGCDGFAPLGGADSQAAAHFNSQSAEYRAASSQPHYSLSPLFDSLDGKTGSHAPTIASFDDGELIAAWYAYDGPHELDGAAIYASRRPAGAAHWSEPRSFASPTRSGNPVLYAEGDDVWMFHAVVPGTGWSTSYVVYRRSADRGHTWSPRRRIDGPLGCNVRFPPLRTADATLLLPAYDDLLQRALFFAWREGDGWELISSVARPYPDRAIQPSVARLSDGTLLAVLRSTGRPRLWVTGSDDGGRHWSALRDGGLPNPGAPALLLGLQSGALLMVFNDSESRRRPLSAALSYDDGRSWTPPRVLVDGQGAYAYPASVQTRDGVIHLLFSDDRVLISHIELNQAWLEAGSPLPDRMDGIHRAAE
jgi:predicted neuraminidase